MTIILTLKNDKYYQEIEYRKNGRWYRYSSNNQLEIRRNIKKLLENIHHCFFYDGKLVVKYCNDMKLVIENYKEIKQQDIAIRGDKSLLYEIGRVTSPFTKGRVGYISKQKIVSLGLTVSLAIGSVFAINIVSGSFSYKKEVQTFSIQQDIKTVTPLDCKTNPSDLPVAIIEEDPFLVEDLSILEDQNEFNLEKRILEAQQLYKEEIKNNSYIPIATRLSDYAMNRIVNFLNSEDGQIVYRYCSTYGVDPYLLTAIIMVESSLYHDEVCPNGKYYNHYGVGYTQIESPNIKNADGSNRCVTAFNYDTNEYDVMEITMENACDRDANIKIGAMTLQNRLMKYQGNIYFTIQSYTYNEGPVDVAIAQYAFENNLDKQEVFTNYQDIGWLDKFIQISKAPNEFAESLNETIRSNNQATYRYLANWQGNYSNGNYISDVLSYYIGKVSQNKIGDKIITMDLTTNQINIKNTLGNDLQKNI